MGHFSDSPHFLLKSFFDGIIGTEPITVPSYEFEWLVKFVSSIDNGDGTRTFDDDSKKLIDTSNNPSNVTFVDYLSCCWNRDISYDANIVKTFNSYIVAPMINITTKGGGIIDLFIKQNDVGFLPIKTRYLGRNGDEFSFTNPDIGDVDPGDNITDILSGRRYTFTFWDKVVTNTFGAFESNSEVYFRKDSLYHEWLSLTAKDMLIEGMGIEFDVRNYINTDKMFSYFSNIFKSHNDQNCRIIFDGMKDYVMRAIPEHQRTERFTELCNIFFDQLYQEIYDLTKNIWSLIDPMEVDQRYLGYLSQYYDMFDVGIDVAPLLHVREFIRDMIWMIKRKGTYTEFYILWRILATTKNNLNIYERWHRRDVENFPDWPSTISPSCTGTWPNFPYFSDTNDTTCVPASAWVDVLYVYRDEYEAPQISGGAGIGWYSKWYPSVVYDVSYISPSGQYCRYGGAQNVNYWVSGSDGQLYSDFTYRSDISYPTVTTWDADTDKVFNVANIELRSNNVMRITIDESSSSNRLAVRISDGGTQYINNWSIDTNDQLYANINHDLNIEYPIVTVWDVDTEKVISAADITYMDTNNVKVSMDIGDMSTSLNKPVAVMVTDGNIYFPNTWNIDTIDSRKRYADIEHNLDIMYPVVIVWESLTKKVIHSVDIEYIDNNNIRVSIYNATRTGSDSHFIVRIAKGENYSTSLSPSGDNMILSTHYILETDVSSEPLESKYILTKELWDNMHAYWEYIRPVNRVSNYRILESPITDMSGKYVHLYDVTSKSSAFLKTISYFNMDIEDGTYVHHQETVSCIWNIIHNLGEDILIQVFDNELSEIVPKEITFGNSTTVIEFDKPENGFAIIGKSDWSSTHPTPVLSDMWNFYHLRQQREIVVQYKYDNKGFYSKNTILSDTNYADAEFSNTEQNTVMVGTGNYIYVQSTPEKIWDVPHNLSMRGVIMAVYTFDNVRIHPDKYELTNSIGCTLEFDSPISGYIVLYKVGDLSLEDFFVEFDDIISSMTAIVYNHDVDGNRIIVENVSYIKKYKDDDYYYFDISLDKSLTYVINEVDIFDYNGNVLFNSLMSDLYKPQGVDLIFHYRLRTQIL